MLLDEITKSSPALPQEEEEKKKEVSLEIQDLTCYWDKVRYLVLVVIQHFGSWDT